MNRNLVKTVLESGGSIVPLLLDPKDSKGLGLMNPSILVEQTKILLNLRNINYTLYHCEGSQLLNGRWGPLSYLHPENDMHLRTWNYMCELNPDSLEIQKYWLTDTTTFDKDPLWDFVGLEDARLVRWENKLFQCGVRRDTTPNGQGRMELSEIQENEAGYKEISRSRIEAPVDKNSYCEKNWMPVLDLPYHFVKWTNPTELVKVNTAAGTSQQVFVGNSHIAGVRDFRGGSQVITWKDYRLCLLHEVNLFNNKLQQKDARYMHRFLVWDKDWNVAKLSEPFSFMDGEIEFGCGLALYKKDLLCTFGFQDNAAYLLRIPEKLIEELLGFKKDESDKIIKEKIKEEKPKIQIAVKNFGKVIYSEKENSEPSYNEVVAKNKPKKWEACKWPTLEITTSIPKNGCVNDCVFCPQRVLTNKYAGDKLLTLDNFKKVIETVPKEITIIFSGFTEPFLNTETTNMILYAHEKGHKLAIFTTGIGMSIDDFDRIKHISFSLGPEDPKISYKGTPMNNGGFTLHIPDQENYAKHPITNKYIKLLEHIASNWSEIQGIRVVCMGAVHEKVKHIFLDALPIEIWARANNLIKEIELKPELKALEGKGLWKSAGRGDGAVSCGRDENVFGNVLLPNGEMVLCCQDYDQEHILGNLLTQNYEDIIPEYNAPFNLCRFCENGVNL